MACLINTFTFVAAPGADNPSANFRGTTFYVEGELYRAGTIPAGDGFDPASATPLGHWLCRGWFVNRTGRPGETDRPDPSVVTTQEYLFSRIEPDQLFPDDQLSSSGLEGASDPSQVALRSVIGGAGRFAGATGEVSQAVTGTNTSELDGLNGPNFRFTFRLK